jgi:Transposase DDE domain
VTLPEMSSGDPMHLVVDSTGVKLYGEGEWKVRKHGYSKRRTWRKVHLGLDVKTGQICAALMTHQDVDDANALPGLLAQISADEPIDTIGGDGTYDTKQCHKVIAGRGATPAILPREGAKPWSEGIPGASWGNEAIDDIARDGRGEWKKRSGYHRRSLIENTMYRYKTLRLLVCIPAIDFLTRLYSRAWPTVCASFLRCVRGGAGYSTASPCRTTSKPTRSSSSATRRPITMSMTFSKMKLITPL